MKQQAFTIGELAKMHGVQNQTARAWVRRGQIEATLVDGEYRIDRAEAEKMYLKKEGRKLPDSFHPTGIATDKLAEFGAHVRGFFNTLNEGAPPPFERDGNEPHARDKELFEDVYGSMTGAECKVWQTLMRAFLFTGQGQGVAPVEDDSEDADEIEEVAHEANE